MGPAYTHPLWPGSAHRVRLTRPFFICVTETTNEHYIMLNPGHSPNTRYSADPESPVVDLSWKQVQTFCGMLSQREGATYRLPTEAEWEYVCRAGMLSPQRFSFGSDYERLPEYAWYGRSRDRASRVAVLRPNAWGVYDMHGNVLELVSDWFSNANYTPAATEEIQVDPRGPKSGLNHTLRGGNWYKLDIRGCECGARYPWPLITFSFRSDAPNLRETIGFRIVRDVEGADEE